MSEIWKPVKGYDGLYEVSNRGNVRSAITKRLRKPYVNDRGYLCVTLSKASKLERGRVHRMVAEAFLKKGPGDTEVGHKNNNPLDNRAENLEWTSRKENLKKEAFHLANKGNK